MSIYDYSHKGASTISNIEGSVFSEQLESFSRGKRNIKKLFKKINLDGVSKQTLDRVKAYIKENDVDYYEVQILTELMAEDMTKNNFLRYQLEQLEKVARNWKPINRAKLKDLIVQSENRLREGASVDDITSMVGEFFNTEEARGDDMLMKSQNILSTLQGYNKTQKLASEINAKIGEEIADIQATHIGISPKDLNTIEEILTASLDGREIDLSDQNEQVQRALRNKLDSSGVSNVYKSIKRDKLFETLNSVSGSDYHIMSGRNENGEQTGIDLLQIIASKLDSIDVTNKSSKEILEELNVDDNKLSEQQVEAFDRLTREMKQLLTPEQLSQADRLRQNQKESVKTIATTVSEKAQKLKGFSKPSSVFEAFARIGGVAGNFVGGLVGDAVSFLGNLIPFVRGNKIKNSLKKGGSWFKNLFTKGGGTKGAGLFGKLIAGGGIGGGIASLIKSGLDDLTSDGADVVNAVKGSPNVEGASKAGRFLKGSKAGLKLLGKLALPVSAAMTLWDAGSSAFDTKAIAEATGKKPEEVTLGDRTLAGVGGAVAGFANIGTGLWNMLAPESMQVGDVKAGDITRGIEKFTNFLTGNGAKTDAELKAEGREASSFGDKMMSLSPMGVALNGAKGIWNWVTGANKSKQERAEESNADIKNLSDEEFAKKYQGMTKQRAIELENHKLPDNISYSINGKPVSREEYFDSPIIQARNQRASKSYLDQLDWNPNLTPEEYNKRLAIWKRMNANMEFRSKDEAKIRYEEMKQKLQKQNLEAKSEDEGGFFSSLKETFSSLFGGKEGSTVVGPTTNNTDNSTVNNYTMQVPSQEVALKALSMVSS